MRTIIAIGGGQLKFKETLEIDKYIAGLACERAKGRANALFLPTASSDSLPYYNSFRKIYTSVYGLKADVGLLIKNKDSIDKIKEKIDVADLIYVGGGDTKLLLKVFNQTGIIDKIKEAYNSGVIITGVSAGAICWFREFFSDSEILTGSTEYVRMKGLSVLNGFAVPHYNERQAEFNSIMSTSEDITSAYCIENLAALVFKNEVLLGALNAGGNAYEMTKTRDKGLVKNKIDSINHVN
ncbi:MAG: Type 1 glutamine amidotransferase-like domain-containing protein [Christensenellaceae bacterium]|jgi:dipeptidase E|nr:Type 1 glutamine amidotransferase-like domain-containing protein [Christensenellaceae bacterium]